MSDSIQHGTAQFKRYLSQPEITALVEQLAAQIRRDFPTQTLHLIGVLKGAFMFTADLMRALKTDVEIDFVRLSQASGTVTLLKDISRDVEGKHVLIVEEIVDSGRSLQFLYDRILASKPASLNVVTLLDKRSRRLVEVPIRYVGRTVDEPFLIGYGLDLEERDRNLPEIYTLAHPH
jgi:hypoxanthine phosphoribosyltransferase